MYLERIVEYTDFNALHVAPLHPYTQGTESGHADSGPFLKKEKVPIPASRRCPLSG